ncbi:hypothetical protein DMN91_007818 [Ooceraea biroi]|uniref:DDE Tnp4 domain-containing protein n=1 Tax=Ooceraea biroi TaxID=2015173 RepID=A0A3L8DG29_OOCBI|nr:hypothetical protein DMN91_007818 [Ooceraea biroi]
MGRIYLYQLPQKAIEILLIGRDGLPIFYRQLLMINAGSTHDAAVFKDSSLYRDAQNVIPQGTRNIDGLEVSYFIIGDPAYPLLSWLLKGYPGTVTPKQESFNTHLNSARVAVEMAKEQFVQQWLNDVVEAETIYPQPVNIINRERDEISGSTVRQHLTVYEGDANGVEEQFVEVDDEGDREIENGEDGVGVLDKGDGDLYRYTLLVGEGDEGNVCNGIDIGRN